VQIKESFTCVIGEAWCTFYVYSIYNANKLLRGANIEISSDLSNVRADKWPGLIPEPVKLNGSLCTSIKDTLGHALVAFQSAKTFD
jgi:hypothetical protein